jgi:prepilin-type N-terminal cleavage/methylation domain-containing protein
MIKQNQQGFTLLEILVVLLIIGIFATISIVIVNSARKKGRDGQRKSDLSQIAKAYEMYNMYNGKYYIPGTGSSGLGNGWFNYEDGAAYAKSMAHGLEEIEYFTEAPRDPSISSANETPQYMVYQCGNGFYVYAKLENPTTDDLATYTNSKLAGCSNLDAYGMNYAVGHK